jgi:hypothetical protein
MKYSLLKESEIASGKKSDLPNSLDIPIGFQLFTTNCAY